MLDPRAQRLDVGADAMAIAIQALGDRGGGGTHGGTYAINADMDAHGPGSSPDHVIADRGWRRWFGLAFLALALIGLWQVPWLGWLVYPFRVFGTFVHELSHGLAAIATGGDFVRFAVSPDLSGVAHSAGGLRMIVASAGYIGSAVFGGALLVLHARLLSSRTLLFGLGVVFGLLCLLFVRNLFGVAAALAITFALGAAAMKLNLAMRDLLVDVLALQLILDGYDSLFTVFALSRQGGVRSDAETMADLTWLPATWWALIWMLVSTAILLAALRLAVRR